MNFFNKYRSPIAMIAFVVLIAYIVVLISTSRETATTIGVGYLTVMITISVVWDAAHIRSRKQR